MSLIAQLSVFVSVPLLTEWLTSRDYVRFDTALCNAANRAFLQYLLCDFPKKLQALIIPKKTEIPLSMVFLEWLTSKKLVLGASCVHITNSFMHSLRFAPARDINLLLSFLPSLKSLKVSKCFPDNVELLTDILRKCPNLEDLALTFSSGIQPCVVAVSQNCSMLKSCNLGRCEDLSDNYIALICRNNTNLTKLTLKYCIRLSGAVLRSVALHCTKLETLSIVGCNKISNRDVQMLSLHGRSPLNGFCYHYFTDVTLRCFIWYHGRRLEKLKICDSHKITNCSVMEISTACPLLTNLNVSYCRKITDAGLTAIANCHQLKILTMKCLYEVSNDSLFAITSRCQALKELHICGNSRITTIGLRSIGYNCWKNLKILSLIAMSLSDELLVSVLSRCASIQDLDISYNSTLTDTALVTALPRCTGIERFQLQCCDNIGDATLCAIAQSCWKVVDIEVNDCKLITDEGVCTLIEQCSHSLRVLDISECMLTDLTIEALLLHASQLTSLDISRCDSIGLESVRAIVSGMKKLRRLKTNVKRELLDQALLSNPDLLLVS